MFFSSKPDTILHVQRSTLVLYVKQGEVARISIPADVEQYLEVYDSNKLRDLVTALVKEYKLKGRRVLISLGDEVLFQQAVPLDKDMDITAEQHTFETKVPFDPDQRSLLSFNGKARMFLLATNRALYEPLVDALTKSGNKVAAVVPAIVYQLRKNHALDDTVVTAMLSNTKPIGFANFLERS